AQADARTSDVGSIVREGALGQKAADALHAIAQQMLRSDRVELFAHALRRVFDAVPAAQRVAVVAWPPEADGCRPLLPEEVLRSEGIPSSAVSTSSPRQAVESGQARYLSGKSP